MLKLLAWLSSFLPYAWQPKKIMALQQRANLWRSLREEHLKKEPACAACGRTKSLEVHHVIPVSFNKYREFDPDNLITLCASPCHLMFGHLLSYHCYNRNVRRMTADFRRAVKNRDCPEHYHDARNPRRIN